jgi:hypothetical protein
MCVFLIIPVVKSKVGISDVVPILSCLNIKSPNRRGLQRRFIRLSDMMVDVNKQMIDNHSYVKHILQRGWGRQSSWCRNRLFLQQTTACEAATQTFCPLVEQCTTKKIAINTVCRKTEHNAHACKRNYSTLYQRVYGFHTIQVCEKSP